MPTEKLLKSLSSTHQGQPTIKLAEKQGYITRVKETKRPEGQKAIMQCIISLHQKEKSIYRAYCKVREMGILYASGEILHRLYHIT
jgi:hypothetical protein